MDDESFRLLLYLPAQGASDLQRVNGNHSQKPLRENPSSQKEAQ